MKAPPEAHPPLPAALAALTGQGVAAIDTPAAVIDLDAMERNLARMAAFARTHGVRLRPHAKMHKSAFLARLQMQAGAVGVCVQKTSEAEALAAAGVTDIYISNQVIDASKLQRVAALAQRLQAAGGRLAMAVDSLEGIARLAAAFEALAAGTAPPLVDVFVELDVGQGRCGVPPGEAAVTLAQAIAAQPVLRFAGLQAYHGRAQHQRGVDERRDAIARAARAVQDTRARIEAAYASGKAPKGSAAATLTNLLAAAKDLEAAGQSETEKLTGKLTGKITRGAAARRRACISLRRPSRRRRCSLSSRAILTRFTFPTGAT